MTLIIGLLGGKGVGKSTAASYLKKRYGANVYAIADTIKDMLRTGFSLTEDQLHGTQAQKEAIDPRYNLSPRQMMQRQGDAIRYVLGNDFLIKRVVEHIYKDKPRLAVVSDVRYVNEANDIWLTGKQYKQHPSVLWRLHRPSGIKDWATIEHRSENEWYLPEAGLEITPGVGIEEIHWAIDKACEMSGLHVMKQTTDLPKPEATKWLIREFDENTLVGIVENGSIFHKFHSTSFQSDTSFRFPRQGEIVDVSLTTSGKVLSVHGK